MEEKSIVKTIIVAIVSLFVVFLLVFGIYKGINYSKSINVKEKNSIDKKEKEELSLVGFYKLIYLKSEGSEYDNDKLKELESKGYSMFMTMKSDKTGNMSIFNDIINFTYDDNYIYSDGDKEEYSFSDNEITIEYLNEKMIFKKEE